MMMIVVMEIWFGNDSDNDGSYGADGDEARGCQGYGDDVIGDGDGDRDDGGGDSDGDDRDGSDGYHDDAGREAINDSKAWRADTQRFHTGDT